MAKTITQQASPSLVGQPRIELELDDFSAAIWNKGYKVYIEPAIKCPCVSKGAPALATCSNCMGTGYVFLGKYETRMLMHSINVNTKFKEWSEERQGQVQISALVRDYLNFMDRITVVDSLSTQSELVFTKTYADQCYAYTIYDIQSVIDCFIYEGDNVQLKRLVLGTDFTIERNKILFVEDYTDDTTISLRYKHNLQYHIIDNIHDVRNHPIQNNVGKLQSTLFPVSAMAKRSHYVIDALNYVGNNVIYNY